MSSAGPSRSRLAELSEQLPHKKVEDTTSFLGPSIGLGVKLRAPKTQGRPVRGNGLHLVWMGLVLTVLLLRVCSGVGADACANAGLEAAAACRAVQINFGQCPGPFLRPTLHRVLYRRTGL